MKKMVLINIITIVVLVVVGIVGFYLYHNATSFVTTDNAKVDGEQIQISSPTSGQIKSLDVKQGDKVKKGDKVAVVSGQSQSGESQTMDIKCHKTELSLKQVVWKVQLHKQVHQLLMLTI